ncbi:hypothetical protein [Mycolicibacterium confluentis]|uniref:Uncharacterized protein n=1 Tax=Mycolicibacterium confluentis TaxID=28047 RepID=A0A7I7XT03_9MYCO|nr:hypothetical protein [Mycolicibacterium confluentis]MCV7321159.1 hypothetical protein [Mycolicibacterium confluentis]ORV21247.1 hypothetical protein AWB99_26955 [Mycolicibacterium confluentis]BBZ32365.1 hypothetical protein MCNF_09700 [Mycolicibacterium confluentis]
MPAGRREGAAGFLLLPPQARRSPVLHQDCTGHQQEKVDVAGRVRDATVVYAADLGRAQAIATRLRTTDSALILLDVRAFVAGTFAEWRKSCPDPGRCRRVAAGGHRLSYCGTVAGLESYLADIARLGMVDGVILSAHWVPDAPDVPSSGGTVQQRAAAVSTGCASGRHHEQRLRSVVASTQLSRRGGGE